MATLEHGNLECMECGSQEWLVLVIQNPPRPDMIVDELECAGCGERWRVDGASRVIGVGFKRGSVDEGTRG